MHIRVFSTPHPLSKIDGKKNLSLKLYGAFQLDPTIQKKDPDLDITMPELAGLLNHLAILIRI